MSPTLRDTLKAAGLYVYEPLRVRLLCGDVIEVRRVGEPLPRVRARNHVAVVDVGAAVWFCPWCGHERVVPTRGAEGARSRCSACTMLTEWSDGTWIPDFVVRDAPWS